MSRDVTAALDRPDLSRLDPGGMLATVEASGAQWEQALATARSIAPIDHEPAAVAVAGMGGSGIAGDVAATANDTVGPGAGRGVPVVAVKGYGLPAWVGPATLVVAVSYSGDTEETLSAVEEAEARGARLVAVTSGGRLADRAEAGGYPVVAVPGGGQPRANLPHLATSTLGVLDRSGVLPGVLEELARVPEQVAALAQRWGGGTRAADNPCKQLAAGLDGRVPCFYGGRGWPALVAQRGKCQVNENAKRPATWGELPEVDHNEIVGWDRLPAAGEQVAVVSIRDQDEHPQVARRFEATLDLIAPRVGATATHRLIGGAPLERFAAGVLFVDLLSVYLAFLEEVDPTPVDAITTLKQRIAR